MLNEYMQTKIMRIALFLVLLTVFGLINVTGIFGIVLGILGLFSLMVVFAILCIAGGVYVWEWIDAGE